MDCQIDIGEGFISVRIDFIDVFEFGEGEEVMNELLDLYKEYKAKNASKDEFLIAASKI